MPQTWWVRLAMINEAKVELLQKELSFYGFEIRGNSVFFINSGFSEPIDIFFSRLKELENSQIGLLKQEWKKVKKNVVPIAGGISVNYLRLLQKSINRLYKKTFHAVLRSFNVSSHLDELSSMCADRMSSATAEQAVVVLSKIEIYEHNIKRIHYIRHLIKLIIKSIHGGVKIASTGIDMNSSVQGPYANLDLPMQERVFTWSDIDEETYARQEMKQKQSRYTMGLEGSSPSESKVGFYFRELRNEPYPFPYGEDEANSPYRKILWGNP